MKTRQQSPSSWLEHKFLLSAFLLLIILLTFCPLTPWIGFQGDDWQHLWLFYRVRDLDPAFIYHRMGLQWFYEMVMPFLTALPWQWFLLTNLLRWLTVCSLFLLAARLFPDHRKEAAWFSLLYILYPGYTISYMPVTFWRGYMESLLLALSLHCMVLWIKDHPRRMWLLALSLLAGLGNMLSTEYYFLLELLRPAVIWLALRDQKTNAVPLRALLKRWLPFLLLFVAVLIWRVYAIQVGGVMGKTIVPELTSRPVTALLELTQQIFLDFFIVIIQPIVLAIELVFNSAKSYPAVYFLVFLSVSILVYFFFRGDAHSGEQDGGRQKQIFLLLLGLGLVSFLLGGGPFWIKKLQVVIGVDVRNRYAMTQGFSFAFLAMALLLLIPGKRFPVRLTLLSLVCGLSAGMQIQAAAVFRSEWDAHRQLMWQMAWRAPSIQKGTVLLMNDPGFVLTGENSLSSELNWTYVAEEHPSGSDYFIYFDEHRFLEDFPNFPTEESHTIEHMGGSYAIDSSQLLVLHFTPSTCLRVLDPELDDLDGGISDFSHDYITFSDPALIQASSIMENRPLDPGIYWEEPAHDWCYYYQKADLARQQGDWQAIVELGGQAFSLEKTYSNIAEVRPFIEGYAHSGQWQPAMQLTEVILQENLVNTRQVCRLWQCILASLPLDVESSQAMQWLNARTGCLF